MLTLINYSALKWWLCYFLPEVAWLLTHFTLEPPHPTPAAQNAAWESEKASVTMKYDTLRTGIPIDYCISLWSRSSCWHHPQRPYCIYGHMCVLERVCPPLKPPSISVSLDTDEYYWSSTIYTTCSCLFSYSAIGHREAAGWLLFHTSLLPPYLCESEWCWWTQTTCCIISRSFVPWWHHAAVHWNVFRVLKEYFTETFLERKLVWGTSCSLYAHIHAQAQQ